IARSMDRDPKHLQAMLKRTHEHKGTSFLEIYQNCNIFNDGAFFSYTEKEVKKQNTLFVEHGKPMVYGQEDEYGIKLDGTKPEIVKLSDGYSLDDLWIHDENDAIKANILIRMETLFSDQKFPRPFGVFYTSQRPKYEQLLEEQIKKAIDQKGKGDLDALIAGNETWVIE
ncbi:MAG: 2-oxoacid:ferredoxin oxidoreductase subunit beta, partial [Cyclobacteriaceae bacterium]|nr:2-oxoacid:ferredoxin oxidoreductase subunit beta [Cyclobacteriaceae bacterium]